MKITFRKCPRLMDCPQIYYVNFCQNIQKRTTISSNLYKKFGILKYYCMLTFLRKVNYDFRKIGKSFVQCFFL